jgi:hypothetical protein
MSDSSPYWSSSADRVDTISRADMPPTGLAACPATDAFGVAKSANPPLVCPLALIRS